MVDTGYVNFLEVRVIGLQRSGNHAIIEWIIDQHRGKSVCFLNNIKHGDFDPFHFAEQSYFRNIGNTVDIDKIRKKFRHVLVYSYEDVAEKMQPNMGFLQSATDNRFFSKRNRYIGESKHCIEVIIIRDPFNFFASRMKKLDSLTGIKDLNIIKENWKLLALAAKNQRNTEDSLVIKYNRWFIDKRYRQQISKKLFGKFSDASLNLVPSIGGGSSFDSTKYGRITLPLLAQKWRKLLEPDTYMNLPYYFTRIFAQGGQGMHVLDRWKDFQKDTTYRKIFADGDLLMLSESLFGEIPDTRKFVEGCQNTPSDCCNF